jgi:hypothetical protein
VDCGKLTRIARCTLAIGVLVLAFTASTASARGIRTGFLDPSALSTGAPVYSNAAAITRVQGAGAQVVRFYLYWNRVVDDPHTPPSNPSNPNDPAYNWNDDGLDSMVNDAQAAGLDVMLTIRSAPYYAQGSAHADSRGTFKPKPAMLAAFTDAATQHFSDVQIWGVWNEPNLKTFLSPQYQNGKLYSPKLYKSLLDAAAPVIHAADPQNIVVAAETAPFHFVFDGKENNPGPLKFLRALLAQSGKVEADVVATHPYTSGNVWHHAVRRDDVSFGDLPAWKKVITAGEHAGRFKNKDDKSSVQLWITEFSWDTKPPDPKAVPMGLHARWTAEALYRAYQLGINMLLWGQLRDYPISDTPFFGQYQSGLRFKNDAPKLSLTAFRFPFVAYAKNGHISAWGRTPGGVPGTVRIERKTSSGWKKVTQLSTNPQGVFQKKWNSGMTSGYLRARLLSGGSSVKFSLKRPPDKLLVLGPFGCGGQGNGNPPKPGCPA